MLIHLLGPLEVHGSRRVELLPRARSLLAALALQPGRPVSSGALGEWLWDEDRYPMNPSSALHTYMSRLRNALRDSPVSITTLSTAYVLEVDPGAIDVHLLEQQVRSDRSGQQADEEGLRRALAIWRGPALCDIPPTQAVLAERSRLGELRLQALEAHYELLVSAGRAAESVSDLYKLVRENPYRERLIGQLMLCLAQLGRRADALQLFRGVDRRFREELGVDPSARLRDLHVTLLRDATPAGLPGGSAAPSARARPSVPAACKPDMPGRGLPQAPGRAIARGDGKPAITIISGPPGSGTTTIALRHARRHQNEYPGGIHFVDMSDPALPPAALTGPAVSSLTGPSDPGRPGPRTLTILDGCGSLRDLRACLARLDGHVLVSSSRRLHGVTGARLIQLGVPPVSQAAAALADMLATGPSATPDELRQLATLCDCNYVALSAAAANLHNLTYPSVQAAIAALSVSPAERVAELACGELSVCRSFRRALSYLSDDESQLLGELAVSRTDWLTTPNLAESVSMSGYELQSAQRGLVEANLLMTRMAADGTPQFRLSPLCAGSVQLLGDRLAGRVLSASFH
jgi:DNA-binding SARP family transcriptional activator